MIAVFKYGSVIFNYIISCDMVKTHVSWNNLRHHSFSDTFDDFKNIRRFINAEQSF